MEATLLQTSRFSSSIPCQIPRPRAPAAPARVGAALAKKPAVKLAAKCASSGSVPERKRESEAPFLTEREKEAATAVETEWLEREAVIMGEGDQGREPNDYSRRARIFDESARVFQARKQRTASSSSSSSES